MARPLSDEKRSALMRAATRVIVTQGMGAQTAVIAREAGVASGSLFTYFETKKVLFNELYLELKAEMASAALESLPKNAPIRKQLLSVWSNWMHWAISDPDKRRALAQLSVSEDVTPETRALIGRVRPALAAVDPWNAETTEAAMRVCAEENNLKLGAVAQPLRVAMTGKTTSPGIFDVLAVLGQQECLALLDDQSHP